MGIRRSFSDRRRSHRSPVLSGGQKQVKILSCSSQVPPPSQGLGWQGLVSVIKTVGGMTRELVVNWHIFPCWAAMVSALQAHLLKVGSQWLLEILQSLSEIQTSPSSPCTRMLDGVGLKTLLLLKLLSLCRVDLITTPSSSIGKKRKKNFFSRRKKTRPG